ncbi:hypothetical protein ACS0PU_009962 [Formica fusca]
MFWWAREHRNSGRRKVNAPTILHEIYTRDGCISGTLNTATWLRAECTRAALPVETFLSTPTPFACSMYLFYHTRAMYALRYGEARENGKGRFLAPLIYAYCAILAQKKKSDSLRVLDRVSLR